MDSLIATLAIWALPVLFAITVHEAAHGYVARYFGDPTAYLAGRVSLNPLRHIDPVGTILVPISILTLSHVMSSGGILFGWAKPVPVDFSRLRNPKADMLWVAAAGPFANLLMALFWTVLLKLAIILPWGSYTLPMAEMAKAGIQINAVLMLLNLLPLLPLDGGRILFSLLPRHIAQQYACLEPYGFPILLVLLFTGALNHILGPLLKYFMLFVASLLNLFGSA